MTQSDKSDTYGSAMRLRAPRGHPQIVTDDRLGAWSRYAELGHLEDILARLYPNAVASLEDEDPFDYQGRYSVTVEVHFENGRSCSHWHTFRGATRPQTLRKAAELMTALANAAAYTQERPCSC